MGRYSQLSPYGQQRYSSNPSSVETLYRSQLAAQGNAFGGSGHQEARIYARARVLGQLTAAFARADNCRDPEKVQELLPNLERDYGAASPPGATVQERRATVAAIKHLSRGNTRQNIESSLRALIGDGFVAYVTLAPAPSDPSVGNGHEWNPFPASGSDILSHLPDTAVSLFRVTDSIPFKYGHEARYEFIGGENRPLTDGDLVILDPGLMGRQERVTVVSVNDATVTLSCSKAHDAGAVMLSGPYPFWRSVQRHSLVVVSAATMSDPRALTTIDRFMRFALGAVSTWLITPESASGSGHTSPFRVGEGKIGETTLGEIEY